MKQEDCWPRIDITTVHATGEETVTYSMTPEEFVACLQEHGQYVLVTNRACSECMYTPGVVARFDVQEMEEEYLAKHRAIECVQVTLANRLRQPGIPSFVVCYAFYYRNWQKNKYLAAAREAGLIQFYPVEGLPTLEGSGRHVIVSDWKL